MKEYRTIIHLEMNGKHEYFGSPSSLFDKYSSTELGISHASLNNYFSKNNDQECILYKNRICTIRRGKLYVKSSTRGRKKEEEIHIENEDK